MSNLKHNTAILKTSVLQAVESAIIEDVTELGHLAKQGAEEISSLASEIYADLAYAATLKNPDPVIAELQAQLEAIVSIQKGKAAKAVIDSSSARLLGAAKLGVTLLKLVV